MSKKFEELDFTDNFFFCKILVKNKSLCIELLELILRIKIKDIIFMTEQKPIEITVDARGVRLDVYVEDEKNTVYDIEMQPTLTANLPKRSRYYQGMIDLNLIERGADFNELKKSYVIFICLEDPFEEGLHIYTFENQCRECPSLVLGDDTTKVFINAAGTADDVSSEMKEFLDYLQGKGTQNDFTRRIANEVDKARIHEEWRVEYMSLLLRDQEMRAAGREEGREEERIRAIRKKLEKNKTIKQIADELEISEEEAETYISQIRD